ncbi:MAG: gamma-glutamyltransferase [Porticoccus sp.]|nr:gamma-glutamyltransferase [Porticoccus sp.]
MKRNLYCLFILVFFQSPLVLAANELAAVDNHQPAIIDRSARFHPIPSEAGMVVSQEAIASRVGADILSKGGNAIDAAVATGFALAVTLPQAGNLGGGGFMMVYLAESHKTVAIDYREMAPASADKVLFLDEQGNVDTNLARFSHRSAGVPGTVAGLIYALEEYGTMSIPEVIEPAITLARAGFTVSGPLSYSLKRATPRLKADKASARYFFRTDGDILQPGDLWVQSDLAKTLEKIAAQGVAGFYEGEVADLIVEEMARGNGIITHDDLVNYKVVERQPIMGDYRGYTLASMPPPSSGGVHLVQMLNILEGWKLDSLGHNSAAYLHRLIETMRRAYADRSEYLGDPDFYPVPVKALTDKAYAKRLREEIDLQKASLSSEIKPALSHLRALPEESPQTTHFSVWDSQGNVVSNTYTLNFSYGSGIAVEDAGFLLNNEMDDFSAKAGIPNAYGLVGNTANAIEPRKRPLSSMTPTIIFKKSGSRLQPIMATGSPGGSTIITVVLQNILNRLEFGMNIAEATAAPRIHHQWLPDNVVVEPGIALDTIKILETMGHNILSSPRIMGRVQAITRDEDGPLSGVTDPRWPGGEAVPSEIILRNLKSSHH